MSDEGKVYTQSMAMIEWLDERYPEPPLMPRGREEKWYVRSVSQIIGCEMHPLNNTRVLKYKAYPTVMAIFERCMKLPAFSQTQPSTQGDAA